MEGHGCRCRCNNVPASFTSVADKTITAVPYLEWVAIEQTEGETKKERADDRSRRRKNAQYETDHQRPEYGPKELPGATAARLYAKRDVPVEEGRRVLGPHATTSWTPSTERMDQQGGSLMGPMHVDSVLAEVFRARQS